MKNKYKQEDINLRVPCRTNLNKVQQIMSEKLGIKLTQNQVVQKLVNNYLEEVK